MKKYWIRLRFPDARFYLLLVLFGVFPASVLAGWWITENKLDRFGNSAIQSIFIQGQRIRIEKSSSTFIFDLSKHEVTLVFPNKLVYWQGSADSLKAVFISTVEQQIVMMLAQMPEYERDKAKPEMEKLFAELREDSVDTVTLAKFSLHGTDSVMAIGKFMAEKYHLFYDTAMIEEVWISKEIKPYQNISLDQLNALMRLFSRPTLYSSARLSQAWKSEFGQGLLMKSVVKTPFGFNVMQVSQVKILEIRDDFFLPPDSYRQIRSTEAVQLMLGEKEKSSVLHGTPADDWKPILPRPIKSSTKQPGHPTFPEVQKP